MTLKQHRNYGFSQTTDTKGSYVIENEPSFKRTRT